MSVLAIKNWTEYQHYKDRTAPWIKLYRDMLDSPMWVMSSDASKLLAVCLMMLALRNDNKIPANPEYVKRFGHLESTPDFSELLKHGFIDFIDENGECLQPASITPATCPPEREGEQSRAKGERETSRVSVRKKSEITLRQFLENCKVSSEQTIPETDPVFEYAGIVGINHEMITVCWKEFKNSYLGEQKTYKDWRTVFRKAVRGNWYKLWFIKEGETAQWTSVGEQARRAAA